MFRFTKKNGTKAAFRAQVSRKHNMFKRFKKRFNAATNPSLKRFCKTEAAKVVRQLKSFAKQYRSLGLGSTSWITKNYNMTTLVAGNRNSSRKYGNRSYSRKTTKPYGRRTRSWSRRSRSRSSSRARRTSTRKSYAW